MDLESNSVDDFDARGSSVEDDLESDFDSSKSSDSD